MLKMNVFMRSVIAHDSVSAPEQHLYCLQIKFILFKYYHIFLTFKDAESRLNLFNLNVARQLAESRIDHERLIRVEDQQQQSWGSWVGSWFSPRKGTEQDKKQSEAESVSSEEGGLVSQLMSDPGEKEKLYAAIGYQVLLQIFKYMQKSGKKRNRIR